MRTHRVAASVSFVLVLSLLAGCSSFGPATFADLKEGKRLAGVDLQEWCTPLLHREQLEAARASGTIRSFEVQEQLMGKDTIIRVEGLRGGDFANVTFFVDLTTAPQANRPRWNIPNVLCEPDWSGGPEGIEARAAKFGLKVTGLKYASEELGAIYFTSEWGYYYDDAMNMRTRGIWAVVRTSPTTGKRDLTGFLLLQKEEVAPIVEADARAAEIAAARDRDDWDKVGYLCRAMRDARDEKTDEIIAEFDRRVGAPMMQRLADLDAAPPGTLQQQFGAMAEVATWTERAIYFAEPYRSPAMAICDRRCAACIAALEQHVAAVPDDAQHRIEHRVAESVLRWVRDVRKERNGTADVTWLRQHCASLPAEIEFGAAWDGYDLPQRITKLATPATFRQFDDALSVVLQGYLSADIADRLHERGLKAQAAGWHATAAGCFLCEHGLRLDAKPSPCSLAECRAALSRSNEAPKPIDLARRELVGDALLALLPYPDPTPPVHDAIRSAFDQDRPIENTAYAQLAGLRYGGFDGAAALGGGLGVPLAKLELGELEGEAFTCETGSETDLHTWEEPVHAEATAEYQARIAENQAIRAQIDEQIAIVQGRAARKAPREVPQTGSNGGSFLTQVDVSTQWDRENGIRRIQAVRESDLQPTPLWTPPPPPVVSEDDAEIAYLRQRRDNVVDPVQGAAHDYTVPRYIVYTRDYQLWKGTVSRRITLHIGDGGSTCMADYKFNRKYTRAEADPAHDRGGYDGFITAEAARAEAARDLDEALPRLIGELFDYYRGSAMDRYEAESQKRGDAEAAAEELAWARCLFHCPGTGQSPAFPVVDCLAVAFPGQ